MRRVLVTVGLVLLLAAPGASQQTGLTEGQIKAAELEVPELVKLFELKPGMTIADVGAGFGAWTVRFSRVVGPSGRVYSTDIGAAQLAALRDAAQREGFTNVTVVEGAANTTNLPALCCDAILIRDAYHHLTQPDAIVKTLAAALKPGGRLAVIDFRRARTAKCRPVCPADRLGHGVPSRRRRARSRRRVDARTDDLHMEREQRTGIALSGAVPPTRRRPATFLPHFGDWASRGGGPGGGWGMQFQCDESARSIWDDCHHTVVCTAYVGAVALAIDVFHQHTVAGPKGPLLTIARRNLEVTVQANQELPLGWMNTLTGPAAR